MNSCWRHEFLNFPPILLNIKVKAIGTVLVIMQFVVENVSEQGVRLGKLLWRNLSHKQAQYASETPLFLLYTRAGHVPHLTDDVLRELLDSPQAQPTMLTLPTL